MVSKRSRTSRPKKRRELQGMFEFRSRGGARPGAGRKPKGERSGVSHATRARLASRYPVHVTMRLQAGLPSLRNARAYRVLLHAFAASSERFGFRLLQYSVQTNHLHMIVEAADGQALSRGLQGLAVRVARALNKTWVRKGTLFADRYHSRILRTPREVRNALAYVIQNARRHGRRSHGPDRFSSAPWFDGWREHLECILPSDWPRPVAHARTWLVRIGWRQHGLVRLAEVPGGTSRRTRPS